MATKLRVVAAFAAVLMLLGCSAPWSSEQRGPTPTPSDGIPVTVASATNERAQTSPATTTPASTPVRATLTATAALPATAPPHPIPTPEPSIVETRVARCCGVFNWIDARHLLVFDDPSQSQTGAWVVDVATGSRRFIAPNFGLPSVSGLLAIPDRLAGHTEIRRLDGTLVSTINNGGVLTWISPDGKQVAWLEDAAVKQTSSLVPRTVRLWAADIDGSNAKRLLEFRASEVQWLPDSPRIVALARAPDGENPGVWVIDARTGSNGVVVASTFLRALQLSPDGSRMAYLEMFSDSNNQDGVWIANTDGSNRDHLRETGSFRWAGDSSHLWFLELAPRDGGNDTLVRVNLADDSVVDRVDLGGRVLNDQWEVSLDGSAVAYWSEADQSVKLKALPR